MAACSVDSDQVGAVVRLEAPFRIGSGGPFPAAPGSGAAFGNVGDEYHGDSELVPEPGAEKPPDQPAYFVGLVLFHGGAGPARVDDECPGPKLLELPAKGLLVAQVHQVYQAGEEVGHRLLLDPHSAGDPAGV